MGQWITLTTSKGPVAAWQAEPAGAPRGGLVVIQEVFGVTEHIRNVAEQYAAEGYLAIAPAFFDLVEPGLELPYDQAGTQRGLEIANTIGLDAAVDVVEIAARAARTATGQDKVATVGYCWGGTVALLAAQRLALPSISYYGGRNGDFLDQPLKAPVQFHFGELDPYITADIVQAQRKAWPDMEVFTYPANHAFNRDASPAVYDPASARTAFARALAFLRKHVG
ncbi:dienelactone hydrolase family protein [Pseudoxanthomonas spadix]|jgi:carboxymethylenebutenolidase|uniref:dienelactone hydrolase family protein n=1 Tax=Pseudoxanthomonas spadix TaxID=415229 RepID=UPI000EFF61A2|nr:dienelactone hydrolase family protein [Pseudoxanthomonas spadix]MBP3975419.1 dienelactone hydrolase family protein [Pseudoxanthomonas spadix]RMW96435.1 dienelactone hydrolase family protein [Pseudoxanthomonas spadix]